MRSGRSSSACSISFPASVSACSRTRASIRARRPTTPIWRGGSPRAASSTSTTRSAPRIARMPRPKQWRICCRLTPACCSSGSCGSSRSWWSLRSSRSWSSWAAQRWRTKSARCGGSGSRPRRSSWAARWRRRSGRSPSTSRSSSLWTWSRRPRSRLMQSRALSPSTGCRRDGSGSTSVPRRVLPMPGAFPRRGRSSGTGRWAFSSGRGSRLARRR